MQLFNLHLLPGSYICVFGKLSVDIALSCHCTITDNNPHIFSLRGLLDYVTVIVRRTRNVVGHTL